MKRPSHHYADYLAAISRVAFALLLLAFLWALADAFGFVGEPKGSLVESWREGNSPFWTEEIHPSALALLIPPLIPLLGAFYLAVVFARHQRPLFSLLALLQGVVLTGASLFLLVQLF